MTARTFTFDVTTRPTPDTYRPTLAEVTAVLHDGRARSLREARAVAIRDAEEAYCAARRSANGGQR